MTDKKKYIIRYGLEIFLNSNAHLKEHINNMTVPNTNNNNFIKVIGPPHL